MSVSVRCSLGFGAGHVFQHRQQPGGRVAVFGEDYIGLGEVAGEGEGAEHNHEKVRGERLGLEHDFFAVHLARAEIEIGDQGGGEGFAQGEEERGGS